MSMRWAMGILGPERHLMRPVEQRERKGLRISDRKAVQKRGPAMGLGPTCVGMSKRLHLVIEEKGGTSHQAALVIGGIEVINTGMGYGQWAPKHSKGMGSQRGE
jgi:hypothetical protein